MSTYTAVQVTTQTVHERLLLADPLNGRLVARSMYNRTIVTADGQCEMNENGDRNNVYTVLGMTTNESLEVSILALFVSLFRVPIIMFALVDHVVITGTADVHCAPWKYGTFAT